MRINRDKLNEKMKENKMTMKQLAAYMGMHRATLFRKLETGGGDLSLNDVAAIESALNLDREEAVSIFLS